MLDFKQIEAFINVAKFKSFSKAAEAIFLSQPTISMHINSLENELDVTLFDRSGKDVQLTPAGLLLYDYAVNMVNMRNQAVQSIAELYNRIEGELHIVSSTTPCKCILPEIIKGFSKKFPNVNFKISEVSSVEAISRVLRFDSEIGIVGKKILNEKLDYFEFTNDNLVLVTPLNNKFQSIKSNYLEFKDIQNEQFILRERSSATRQIFDSSLSSAGYDPGKLNIFSEVSSMEAVLQFVKHGLGVTIISECAAKEYIDFNLVRRFYIKDLNLSRKIYLVKYSKRTLSPVAKMFEKYVLKKYDSKP